MDKFKALEPVKLYQQPQSAQALTFRRPQAPTSPLIGILPTSLHLLILQYLAVPDIPAYARTCRSIARLASSDLVWKFRYDLLGIEQADLGSVLDELENRARSAAANVPPTLTVDVADDDFGDFASGAETIDFSVSRSSNFFTAPGELGDFVGGGAAGSPRAAPSAVTPRALYIRAHKLLKSLTPALLSPSHQILSDLFPQPSLSTPAPSLHHRSKTLHLLHRFLARLSPVREAPSLLASLRAATDRFDATLLSAFDVADGRGDEAGMREAAAASWEIWDPQNVSFGVSAEWEMGRVWGEKREIFYVTSGHKPLDNFTENGLLNFDPMDKFMNFVLDAVREHGSRAVRVFPPAAGVLIAFSDRIALEVVAEYITPLLTHARSLANGTMFLKATAACFGEAWRMVDTIVDVAGTTAEVSRTQAEDVVYRMFEPNMDEYLDEEIESLKQSFELICRDWEQQTQTSLPPSADPSPLLPSQQPSFVSAASPALLKRNVLSTFTSLLLLPVSIIPRTVETVSGAAVHGITMLDPRRWGGSGASTAAASDGYHKGKDGGVLWEDTDAADDEYTDLQNEKQDVGIKESASSLEPPPSARPRAYDNLQLLLSLDITLELIHAARDSLKRVEIFVGYPGTYGQRVRETIEEIASELLGALGERHVKGGFDLAISQMRTYEPPPVSETEKKATSTSVAPLVQFFELVHIGDMIQSIIQVYFDKELTPHVDVSDFLNPVMREKKRFENVLDDSVAKGLNAGIEVLMNQVDHIILTLTPARVYYPPDDAPLLLGPSLGCTEAIKCLEEHLRLLKGNVNREVLEVFEGEVGVRLISILQKHIKRQIISLNGGFQVIADLNAYHAFVSTLKIPSLTSDFSHLKMLGHVYVVEDAKDLAQIVRDVTRYGGAYRPEDVYEFIQRRSDWKKIEKVVDKTMYNLNLREDCTVC
ncbi:hypothetical protein FA95DRAFT_1583077 [Auriscalpium vulgare]|uniref:Uncharacterized protein n=1 Tax=Auriscalpium vulgare TaxID=40419 RepID=A0ACB8RRV9_9AGAM|nr:hypothetical protein FA95DRAFT_1583077 [Auriscalpium vulgare]